jgi:hypothetical protein
MHLPGTAAWIAAPQFHAPATQSPVIRDLIVRYNERPGSSRILGLSFLVHDRFGNL